jgi:hypothetical protein
MPAPHLVPKEPNPTGRPTAHGAFGDDAHDDTPYARASDNCSLTRV